MFVFDVFVACCVEIFDVVLYDLNFAKTFSSLFFDSDSVSCSGLSPPMVVVAVAGFLVSLSLAFAYSLRISTCISLGEFVSIIYFRETVSKYLYGIFAVLA